jgi:magnesium-transporting ATPase (P-type)
MSAAAWIVLILIGLFVFCGWRMHSQGFTWKTTKRWLVHVPLAVLIIVVFMGIFFYADYKRISDEIILKWMNILLTAAFVFGFTLKAFWQCRRRRDFWAGLTTLIILHFALLPRLHWQKESYFWLLLVIGIPELFVVLILLSLTLGFRLSPPDKSL